MLSKFSNRVQKRLISDAKLILKYFFKYKLTPFELAKLVGVPEEFVINVLNDQDLIQEIMPEDSNINKKIASILAYQNRNIDFCFLPSVLELFNDSDKWHFLTMLVLTFRLHLKELAAVLKIDEEELYETLEKHNPHLKNSFKYLFNGDNYPQDIANQRLINYISEYYDAWQNKNQTRLNELLMYINDTDYHELIENYHQEQLTDEQLLILINYQIKYGLKITEMIEPLKISKTKYQEPVRFFITNKEYLQDSINNLANYNKNLVRTNRGKHE